MRAWFQLPGTIINFVVEASRTLSTLKAVVHKVANRALISKDLQRFVLADILIRVRLIDLR